MGQSFITAQWKIYFASGADRPLFGADRPGVSSVHPCVEAAPRFFSTSAHRYILRLRRLEQDDVVDEVFSATQGYEMDQWVIYCAFGADRPLFGADRPGASSVHPCVEAAPRFFFTSARVLRNDMKWFFAASFALGDWSKTTWSTRSSQVRGMQNCPWARLKFCPFLHSDEPFETGI